MTVEMQGDDGLTYAAFTMRNVAGDHVLECLECGALVTYDRAVMWRHIEWHQRINRTVP